MQNSRFKNTVTLFFLSAFLFLRVVNAHAIVHLFEEEPESIQCELCEVIVENVQQDLVLANAETKAPYTSISVQKENTTTVYKAPCISIALLEHLHNIPPPTV